MVTTRTRDKLADKRLDYPNGRLAYPSGELSNANVSNHDNMDEPTSEKHRRVSKLSRADIAPQAPSEKPDYQSNGKTTVKDIVKGALEGLPLDIIFEIFSHLHPLDLCTLTHTSKAIRGMLMSKTSVSVWKAARLALEPPGPECPPDQSEFQWAVLLYDTKCMRCGSGESVTTESLWTLYPLIISGLAYLGAVLTVEWSFRLRGCWHYFGKLLINTHIITKQFPQIKGLVQRRKVSNQVSQFENLNHHRKMKEHCPQAENVEEILGLLPHTLRRQRWERWYLRLSVKTTIATLLSFQDEMHLQVQDAKDRCDVFKETKKKEASAMMALDQVMKQWVHKKELGRWVESYTCKLWPTLMFLHSASDQLNAHDLDASGISSGLHNHDFFDYEELDQTLAMTMQDFGPPPDTTGAGGSRSGGGLNVSEGATDPADDGTFVQDHDVLSLACWD